MDEIWSYVRVKQHHIRMQVHDVNRTGDVWTFVALDPDTKHIPAYRVGKRTKENAVAFLTDLSDRLAVRIQLSSDALNSYEDAVERVFGADVDYGQIVKFYDSDYIGPGRYSRRA